MTTATTNEKKLYSFNWIGGGYNSVYATNKREALKEIDRQFGGKELPLLKVDKASIKSHKTRAQQDAYYKSLPYWD